MKPYDPSDPSWSGLPRTRRVSGWGNALFAGALAMLLATILFLAGWKAIELAGGSL